MKGTRKAMPPRLLLVTLNRAKGVGLLRGPMAGECLRYVDSAGARWSEGAFGWVVPLEVAIDVTAVGEYLSLIVKVSEA